jgi:hypothetical protein
MSQAVSLTIKNLQKSGLLSIEARLAKVLTTQILRSLTFWIAENELKSKPLDGSKLIHQTVFDVMCLILPYLGDDGPKALEMMLTHLRKSVG